jgi:acyl transferase domain-containing protein
MAAFLASVIKACLIFEHKIVPANVNLVTRNPKILWDEYNLNAPTEAVPLPCRSLSGKSLISLAGSGIGGSNGHVVLESPPLLPKINASVPADAPILFLVGGLSPRATSEISDSLVKLLSNDSSPAALSTAVCHARRARQCPWRTFFTFTPGSTTSPKVENPVLVPNNPPLLVYVFTGQGPQHVNMGRSLFNNHPVFRKTILDLDALYKKSVGVSLLETTGLFAGDNTGLLHASWGSDVTISSMTMVQIALYELLTSIGLKPHILVGHSAGEAALVYASGAGSKEMAFEISIARARAMKLTEILDAGMASMSCNVSCVTRLIERVTRGETGVLEIACYNLPDTVVVSGSRNLIEKAVELAQAEGIITRSIRTLNPSHSSLMDVCKEVYMRGMDDIFTRYGGLHKPIIKTYSSVGGQPTLVEEFTPAYFWANARNPVHFHEAITAIIADTPDAAFVEISPHPALSSYIMSLGVAAGSIVCPMRRPSKNALNTVDLHAFAGAIGRIATWGINTIDLTPLYGRASRDPDYEIPYPFTTRHFAIRFDGPREREASAGGAVSLRVKMNSKTYPEFAEHTFNGEPICPGGAYIDMVSSITSYSFMFLIVA